MTVTRHAVRTAEQAKYQEVSPGLSVWSIVDETVPGAVHTGFAVCELAPGVTVPPRVQSFEECFYVLAGSPVLQTTAGAVLLAPGDYGLIPIGEAHSWRSEESPRPVRWVRMVAPQPRGRYGGDVVATSGPARTVPSPVDVRDPRNRRYGHVEPVHMDMNQQSQHLLAVSASMRTALLVYSGITVKMMVDSDLGAQLTTMFMVQYAPDGVAGPHDHPFEETYLFLEGRAEATFDGERYQLGPGDVAWAGVGCVHGFRNAGSGPLRWLETQAPQPPGRHSYRFVRDWTYLRETQGEGERDGHVDG